MEEKWQEILRKLNEMKSKTFEKEGNYNENLAL